ncbi:MAG: DUF4296 domain-containing protein [Capnocytophaga ochracea]
MKKIIYIFALLLIVVACKKNIVPKPDKFLDEKQMESMLYDLAVLESMKVSQAQMLDSLQFNSKQFIYKKYQLDSLSLAQNMVYYASLPKDYDRIVRKVEEKLKKQRDSIGKLPLETLKENPATVEP